MSLAAELSASTNGRTATNLIAQLDDYCQQHDEHQKLPNDYRTGPFGVFEVEKRPLKVPNIRATTNADSQDLVAVSEPTLQASDAISPAALTNLDTNIFPNLDAGQMITIPEDAPSNSSSIEEIENMRSLDLDQSGFDNLNTDLVHASTQSDFWQMGDPFSFMGDFGLTLDLSEADLMSMYPLDTVSPASALNNSTAHWDSANTITGQSPRSEKHESNWAHLLAEAPTLLRHYQSNKEGSEPAKQSFWKSFVLPSAMRTFAELSVFGTASDVSTSIFYSTLANSAFSMQRSDSQPPNESHWDAVGRSSEEAARYFLKSAARQDGGQSDCQELLSATLSLALVSVSLMPN